MESKPNVVLVPADLGAPSKKALETAKDLVAKLGGEVVVVHVYTLPSYGYPGLSPMLYPSLNEEIAAAAKRAIDQLTQAAPGVRVLVREGDPAAEILRVIDELHPSMVVMGTHGRTGLSHFFLGSVAEKVLRQSKVPVLTIRVHDEPLPKD